MKKILYLSLTLLIYWNTVQAQQRTVSKQFDVGADQKLELNLKFGDSIVIEAWDQNKVSFNADIEINGGKLNEALQLDFNEQSDGLHVTADYDQNKLKSGKASDCPNSDYSTYNWSDNSRSNVVCSNITYKLFVPANIDITVESISGNIELVGVAGPVRAKSISGFVDLSWPSGKPADINLKTISGEAFTNVEELQLINKKDHIPLVGYTIKGKIRSGGPAVSLESISGNIYLRESQG